MPDWVSETLQRLPPAPVLTTGTGAENGIVFDGVTVAYRGTIVLDRFDLTVEPGEIMALIGPSGSGKTTALRAVAGFVQPVRGRVRIGARDVTTLPPYARSIGMVVQNYALFPHMRVDENVAFGLRARRAAESLVQRQVRDCLRLVGMTGFERRFPRELSGGQQQRIAIARALAIEPQVLLLDEPLSALDAQIRRSMLEELARLHRELPSLTVLYVTHDQTEALTLANRIAIMRDGRLVAHGDSRSLYHRPPNRFSAEFLGRANLLPVRVEVADDDGFACVRLGALILRCSPHPLLRSGDDGLLCIRPHDVTLSTTDASNTISGVVQAVQWQGDLHSIVLEVHGHALRLVSTPLRTPPEPGARLSVAFGAEDAILIPEDAAAE